MRAPRQPPPRLRNQGEPQLTPRENFDGPLCLAHEPKTDPVGRLYFQQREGFRGVWIPDSRAVQTATIRGDQMDVQDVLVGNVVGEEQQALPVADVDSRLELHA